MSVTEAEGPDPVLGSSLSVRWVQGFPEKSVAFIDDSTICYPCGNFLIFVNIENEKRTFLQCMDGKVGAVATNIPCGVVAFSDRKFKPSIYIYNFPALTKRIKLKGNAELDYTLLEFNYSGLYLASYSTIPEHEVSLWDWEENMILCRRSKPGVEINQMTFNPMNWRQLCLSSKNYLSIWNIERCEKNHYFKPKTINLPTEDGTFINEFAGLFSQGLKDPLYGPVLPVSAVAGLVGIEAETFRPKGHFRPLVHPVAHCWNSSNDLYVCCEDGHILLVNGESLLVTILSQSPQIPQEHRITITLPPEILLEDDLKKTGYRINTMAFHKEGLFISGNDGILHALTIKENNYTITNYISVQESVKNILFSPDYKQLLIQTDKGSVFNYTFGEESKTETILDASGGKIQAIDFVTPGTQYCMSITILGEIYIWLIEDGYPVGRLCLNTEVSNMACSPSSFSAAVGTTKGNLLFIDISNIKSPRIVHKSFLSESSIQHVCYDQNGLYLIIGTSDRHIFFLHAKPSQSFKIIGFTVACGSILQISTVCAWGTNEVKVIILAKSSEKERSSIEIISLNEILLKGSAKSNDERGNLKSEFFERSLYEIDHPINSAVLDFQSEKLYGFCNHVPYICTYSFPQKESKNLVLKLENKIPSKHFGTGMLYLSFHGQWLASGAKDGILNIRDVNTLEPFAQSRCHSYQGQGIQSLTISFDGQSILVNGKEDGSLVCLKWKRIDGNLAQEVTGHFQSSVLFLNNCISEENTPLKCMRDSKVFLDSLHGQSPFYKKETSYQSDKASESEITWLQKKIREATKKEAKEYSGKKKEIKEGIKILTKTIQDMIGENELASEIAQLEQQEFSLDLEEMERLHNESEEEVERIKKEAEMENLAKQYLCYVLEEECWHSMHIKGRSLKSFHTPLEVKNFPMKARTTEELEELETVLQIRKTEATEYKLRKEIVEVQSIASSKKQHEDEEDEDEDEETLKKESNLPNYLLGSLSSELGADTSMLYSQMELHTREEKINQIILLKDIIYKVKTTFNKDFDAVFRQKMVEMIRVKEKNKHVQRIITDLDLGEQVWQPEFEDCEKPENILVVQDHEIKVEKILTPWEKEQAALAEALEQERRLLAQADDARQRALMDMMGGVLEIKKEDILKMVIPQPAFMIKPDSLWSDDEKKLFKEYEKKVKELNEERERYKKSLDAELKKLQNIIQETTQIFDDNLRKLFKKKVKSDMVINQEELKIANLTFSLLLDEELQTRQLELYNFLERKQKEKKSTAEEIYKIREELDTYKESYDILVAEDKILERGFKKEFAELSGPLAEALQKMYKRRPRLLKQKQAESANPYGDRPGSVQIQKENIAKLMNAMDELDNPNNMPEGLEPSVWTYFCTIRRSKMENEQKLKQKAIILLEIQAFLRKRIEDDEKVQVDIEKVFQEILILQEEKMNYQLDLTIQLLLKQGQVEMENFQLVLEYTDSILINRMIIEDLNSIIRAQGQKKITSMVESKDFHNGIFQIEWEHKKMEMEMEDLNHKAWDIQMLFLSRDRQMFLKEPNYELLISYQIFMMEQTITVIDKAHKREVESFKKLLKQLGKFNSQKDLANYILSCELQEELVTVSERREICKSLGSKLTCEKIAQERYDAMLQQRRLVDISKDQAEQISILQAEVERLRMKTFPALVQM